MNAGMKSFVVLSNEDRQVLYQYFCKAEWPSEKQMIACMEDLKYNSSSQYFATVMDNIFHSNLK